MSDIRTVWLEGGAALLIREGALARDDGLETAVVLSLFTDRLAAPGDVPAGAQPGARRGWWGDALADVPGDLMGSRLWLLHRAKQEAGVLTAAEGYAREALQWLVEDGVATAVEVTASFPRAGVLALAVQVQRPTKPVAQFRFDDFWKGL